MPDTSPVDPHAYFEQRKDHVGIHSAVCWKHHPDCAYWLARASIGPDDIVVSREALTTRLLSSDPHELEIANQILCAALSQPHPAQEQQT